MMNRPQQPAALSRRHVLRSAACGFGGVALHSMLVDAARAADPLAARPAQFAPRAKRVIFLFMQGGPSQIDLFDPKPRLIREHGQPVGTNAYDTQLTVGLGKYLALAPRARFA